MSIEVITGSKYRKPLDYVIKKDKIITFLVHHCGIKFSEFELLDDFSVFFKKDVDFSHRGLEKFPFTIKKVWGKMNLDDNNFETLECLENIPLSDYISVKNNKLIILPNMFFDHNNNLYTITAEQLIGQQILDTRFLDAKYKKLMKTMKYSLKTVCKYKKEFQLFLDAEMITYNQVEKLNIWS